MLSDVKTLLEERLIQYFPGIDLSPGSPAQTQIIEPVVARLGVDPLDTDVATFIKTKLAQEVPSLYTGSAGAVEDVLINPHILLLEPFKRELLAVLSNQTFRRPLELTGDDASDLAANFFLNRDTGGYAVGTVRVFFDHPVTVDIELAQAFYTSGGLVFNPITARKVLAEAMVFNQSGNLYFVDVPVKAASQGSAYNVDKGTVTQSTGLYGVVSCTNLQKFTSGRDEETPSAFVANAQTSLVERTLTGRRGIQARVLSQFTGDVTAVTPVGRGDAEMDRDLLTASSSGHMWVIGTVNIFKDLAYVQCKVVDGPPEDRPQIGDDVRAYLNQHTWPALPQEQRMLKLAITAVLAGPIPESTPYQCGYLVQFSGTVPEGVTFTTPAILDGGITKKDVIRVSSVAPMGAENVTVVGGSVHVGGCVDVYINPAATTTDFASISSVSNALDGMFLQKATLTTHGSDIAGRNSVSDTTIDFVEAGVVDGDCVQIVSGRDVGVYRVLRVSTNSLALDKDLTSSEIDIRYSVLRSVTMSLDSPQVVHLPFGASTATNIQTTVGSTTVTLTGDNSDALDFGARVGDKLEILAGPNAGIYNIKSFTGGASIVVDRAMVATGSGYSFRVYTQQQGVQLPLVRLASVDVLDSVGQTTGLKVPRAKPLAVVATADSTTSTVRTSSATQSAYIIPALNLPGSTYLQGGSVNAIGTDAMTRYSSGYDDVAGGLWRAVVLPSTHQAEIIVPKRLLTECCGILLTVEGGITPPDLPSPGDAINVTSGPNQGGYLVKEVHKFNYETASYYLVEIYGTFPSDPLRSVITFINAFAPPAYRVPPIGPTTRPSLPTYFQNLYNSLGTKLWQAFLGVGAAVTDPAFAATAQNVVDSICSCSYSVGIPSRSILRTYMEYPTEVTLRTCLSDSPTEFTTGKSSFRPSPDKYIYDDVVPPKSAVGTSSTELYRDVIISNGPTYADLLFTDSTHPQAVVVGVRPGDLVHLHKEIIVHGSGSEEYLTAVRTVAGSTTVQAPHAAGEFVFSTVPAGSLVFIDEGSDTGGYQVISKPDDNTLVLDKTLGRTTPYIFDQGFSAQYGHQGTADIVQQAGKVFSATLVNKYVTLYGIDTTFQGTYKITAVATDTLTVDRSNNPDPFPAYPVVGGRWVITESITPVGVGDGTELVGVQPIRIYAGVPDVHTVIAASSDMELSESVVRVSGAFTGLNLRCPYRITRSDTRRITPDELASSLEGPYCYFDTEVVSLGCGSPYTLRRGDYLELKEGSYSSLGYDITTEDRTLTYSTREVSHLVLPTRILPIGVPSGGNSYFLLPGTPVQLTYEYAPTVAFVQSFLSSPDERNLVSDHLARVALPARISYEASYSGGSASGVVYTDIVKYVKSIPINGDLDVSMLQLQIENRGGNPETPTKAYLLVHDWSRQQKLLMSENKVGASDIDARVDGTARVVAFVTGNDVSSTGFAFTEGVKLTQT